MTVSHSSRNHERRSVGRMFFAKIHIAAATVKQIRIAFEITSVHAEAGVPRRNSPNTDDFMMAAARLYSKNELPIVPRQI